MLEIVLSIHAIAGYMATGYKTTYPEASVLCSCLGVAVLMRRGSGTAVGQQVVVEKVEKERRQGL